MLPSILFGLWLAPGLPCVSDCEAHCRDCVPECVEACEWRCHGRRCTLRCVLRCEAECRPCVAFCRRRLACEEDEEEEGDQGEKRLVSSAAPVQPARVATDACCHVESSETSMCTSA